MIRGAWVGAVAALVALSPAAAFGWGDGGHEIVASIAYSRLSNRAKGEADRLLAIPVTPAGKPEPSDPAKRFMHASHWADDVRRVLTGTADEHFIDQPISADGTALPADLPKPDNVIVALQKYVQTLRTSRDDPEKAKALRFVLHFVGDIHQPLHCATRVTRALPEGDRGGNDFFIQLRDANGQPRRVKLHAYWDEGLGTFPQTGPAPDFNPPPDEEIPPARAAVLDGHPDTDPQITAGGPFNFQGWAAESKSLAIDATYDKLQPNGTLPRGYQKTGVEAADRRAAWAGYRLANLLNAIWHD